MGESGIRYISLRLIDYLAKLLTEPNCILIFKGISYVNLLHMISKIQ